MIKVYHTDNRVFNASDFMEDILNKQKIFVLLGLMPHIKMGHQSAPSRQWYGKKQVGALCAYIS